MVDRPILRFPNPTRTARRTGNPRHQPRPRGPGRQNQGNRFQASFDRLAAAFENPDPEFILRQDPIGIAPERALVFVTAGNIQNFSRAAQDIGLEIFSETELEDVDDIPDGFEPAGDDTHLPRTLYATMPTLASFQQILTLWNSHQNGNSAPTGAAPWWSLFDLLLELRPWGPEDRLPESARSAIEDRLPFDDDDDTLLELEIWPSANAEKRAQWRGEVLQRINNLGGEVLHQSSISEVGFVYEAILARLSVRAVRSLLNNPQDLNGLATLEGVQFILPKTIGQSLPYEPETQDLNVEIDTAFDENAPFRAAVLDGTPMAAHPSLSGGVSIEDIHDLVRLSRVDTRFHATAMASLILRGDLAADGRPLQDARLLSIPVLIDEERQALSPDNYLFVDLVHTTLLQIFSGDEPLGPNIFVVNFSVGIKNQRFSGRISSLARLMDWWSATYGILFIISSGNIDNDLPLGDISTQEFEDSDIEAKRQTIRTALRGATFERTLLAPAESLNALSVGALSQDLTNNTPPAAAGILTIEDDLQLLPQFSSALGLGLHRCIKPDLLISGGRIEARILPTTDGAILRPVMANNRTGLIAAAPGADGTATQKSRGTSPAAALVTRAVLQSAEYLTGEDGAFEGQELPNRQLALLTRALAVNAARWPQDAGQLYDEEIARLGRYQHSRAKEEVCRFFGHGVIDPFLMQESPETGVTMVGLGSIRKNQAQVFQMPLPPSMSGSRVPRSMRVTLAWFSPINPARAQYRLAGLEAIAADGIDGEMDEGWGLDFQSDGLTANMVKRGTVWSRRLINRTQTTPNFDDGTDIPICVQCRDTAGNGLSPDDDIEFAIAVTLEVEAEIHYDIHDEIEQRLRLRLGQGF